MKNEIGNTAGKIWGILKEKGDVDTSQVPRILKEKTLIAYQAMGWLAREDKIAYRTEGDKTFIYIADGELKI
jgi:hypothetical protein